jgi:hypothetical protein
MPILILGGVRSHEKVVLIHGGAGGLRMMVFAGQDRLRCGILAAPR